MSRLTGIAVMIVQKVFPYRQALGSTLRNGSYAIPNGSIWAGIMASQAGLELDNHMCFIVVQYGEERAFQWSDNVLIECKKLFAGDCNREYPTLSVLWESKIHTD